MPSVNVALIGQGFMGRSHSNAWGQVAKFFQPPIRPIMHTVFGQEQEDPQAFADNWGWQNASTDWEALVMSITRSPSRCSGFGSTVEDSAHRTTSTISRCSLSFCLISSVTCRTLSTTVDFDSEVHF